MAQRCDPVDPAWGEYIFLGAQERRAGSLYENQNSLKIPKSEHCVVRIPTPEGNVLVEGGDDLSVRLFIEGGSDFPRIRLRVIAGEKAGLPTKMEAIFLPWSPVGFDFPRSSVALGPQTPSASEFTFSLRLKDLTFQAPFNLRQDVRQRYAHVFGSSEAARITFNYKDPIMLNCNADLSWLSASHRDTMRNFQQLRSCSKVVILTRSSVKLMESYNYFTGQPTPTRPHLHRWGTRQSINEHAVFTFPVLSRDSPLANIFRRRVPGWPANPPGFATNLEAYQMPPPLTFLDERHYEVFQMGSLCRDVDYEHLQLSQGPGEFSGFYDFSLAPFMVDSSVSDRSFLVRLNLRGDQAAPSAPCPEPGTRVELQVRLGNRDDTVEEKLVGLTIPSPLTGDEYDVSIMLTRTAGGAGFILGERHGFFAFGQRYGPEPSKAIKSSIKQVMYGGPGIFADNWLKRILLAHETPRPTPPPFNQAVERHIASSRLNEQQAAAFRQCVFLGPTDAEKIAIIEGPPGTGKSYVIERVLKWCLDNGWPVLVTAGSNNAVNINAERLLDNLRRAGQSTHGIYRILPDGLEQFYSNPEIRQRHEDDDWKTDRYDIGGPLRSPPSENSSSSSSPPLEGGEPIDTVVRSSLRAYLRSQLSHTDMDRFSLPKHILDRLEVVLGRPETWRARTSADAEEHKLLTDLEVLRRQLETWRIDPEDDRSPLEKFDNKWLEVQQFYMARARCLFVTAATAGTKQCRVFRPWIVMQDESSQVKEVETLNPAVRHVRHGMLKKLILLGDTHQLPPCVRAFLVSEFGLSALMPLMTRLIAVGHPYVRLLEQFRMHPDISALVSQLFYDGQLVDHPSTSTRGDTLLFEQWLATQELPKNHSIFMNILNPSRLFFEKGGTSLVNTTYAAMTLYLINTFRQQKIPPNKLMVICFYAAQRRLYVKMFRQLNLPIKVAKVSTVDGSQGKEAPFVILDTVTPGGKERSMGFLRDLARTCVALSRAKDGLIIIGSTSLAAHHEPSNRVQVWKTIIKAHQEKGAVSDMTMDDQDLRSLLNVPGAAYRALPRR